MQSPAPGGQLARLQRLLLQKRLEAAKEEHTALKSAVHHEVDAQRESKKAEKLQAKLEQLGLNAAALDQQLGWGLPPGWASSSSGSGSTEAAADCFIWGPWQSGTEIHYSTQHAAAGTGNGARQLQVAHTPRPVRLRRSALPFAIGGLRAAYYAQDASGGRFVLKRTLLESRRLEKRVKELHVDAEAAALSSAAAVAFNAAACGGTPEVAYLPASVVVLEDPASPAGKAVYLKEPWMAGSECGKWVKWSRNDGHLFAEGASSPTIQTFTHFSLRWLGDQLGCPAIVLDAQGIQSGDRFTLTDPALCTADHRFGKSDMGQEAISAFLAAHSCGSGCNALGHVRCSA